MQLLEQSPQTFHTSRDMKTQISLSSKFFFRVKTLVLLLLQKTLLKTNLITTFNFEYVIKPQISFTKHWCLLWILPGSWTSKQSITPLSYYFLGLIQFGRHLSKASNWDRESIFGRRNKKERNQAGCNLNDISQ